VNPTSWGGSTSAGWWWWWWWEPFVAVGFGLQKKKMTKKKGKECDAPFYWTEAKHYVCKPRKLKGSWAWEFRRSITTSTAKGEILFVSSK
jgi:hypothetical protein